MRSVLLVYSEIQCTYYRYRSLIIMDVENANVRHYAESLGQPYFNILRLKICCSISFHFIITKFLNYAVAYNNADNMIQPR